MAEKPPSKPPVPEAPDLVAVLAAASEADFERVQARIAECRRELNALTAVEKILMARLGRERPSAPAKPPRATKPTNGVATNGKGNVTADRRVQIAKYLNHSGATRPAIIAKDLEIPDGSITFVLDHPWFVKDVNGIKLSAEGRQAAGAT